MGSKNRLVFYYNDTIEKENIVNHLFESIFLFPEDGRESKEIQINIIGAYFPVRDEISDTLQKNEKVWGILEVVDEKKYLLAKLKYGI